MRKEVAVALVLATTGLVGAALAAPTRQAQPRLERRIAPLLHVGQLEFKDLNRNGRLDPYEDWRLSARRRATDLLGRMSLDDKAGAMMHGSAPTAGSEIGVGERYDIPAARTMIIDARVNNFITRLAGDPRAMAEENNKLQEIAEGGPLGIPATISSDPRNAIRALVGASVRAGSFSRWPESTGLAATRDPALVRQFADIARREYAAVGIRQALSPQVDLATEPRWPRIAGTFGEDPQLAKQLAEAYVDGMQNGKTGINGGSVLAVVKHWAGYGAAKDGWDSHNYYGRFSQYTGDNLPPHLIPFEGAFNARVSGVMPTYSILADATLNGKPIDPVGVGFSKFMLTDLLRGRYKFDGVVLSDWLITSDCPEACRNGARPGERSVLGGMPWGVEHLSQTDRFALAVNAGVDQFGGVVDSDLLVAAVRQGKINQRRINQSVTRILIQKFELGLFEDPYVDPAEAARVVGSVEFLAAGEAAQERSLVLLKKQTDLFPIPSGTKVYLWKVSPEIARQHGWVVVDRPQVAQISIIRMEAPFDTLHPGYFFGSRNHEGRLSYNESDEDYRQLTAASAAGPAISVVHLERPLVLSNIIDKSAALIGNFGINDGPLLNVLAGKAHLQGRLPFELPRSEDAVLQQRPDVPRDSRDPLFPFGFGL